MSVPDLRPLRYAGTCASCGVALSPGTRALWHKERRQATCEPCLTASDIVEVPPETPPLDRGRPGASALREGQRRSERREAGIKAAHPRLGKVILALSEEPQATGAWQKGGEGERVFGESLERIRADGLGVLHDRRIPGSKANIDHLVIGPAGVFVIDTKRYTGRIERRDRGWLLQRDWRLYVNGRDRTKLAEAMPRQVDAVRKALAPSDFGECRVMPVLCFVGSEWGFAASPFFIGEVRVLWPKAVGKLVRSEGPLSRDRISELEQSLALALPTA